jgi:FtsZ-binding cell division protein ZapB
MKPSEAQSFSSSIASLSRKAEYLSEELAKGQDLAAKKDETIGTLRLEISELRSELQDRETKKSRLEEQLKRCKRLVSMSINGWQEKINSLRNDMTELSQEVDGVDDASPHGCADIELTHNIDPELSTNVLASC